MLLIKADKSTIAQKSIYYNLRLENGIVYNIEQDKINLSKFELMNVNEKAKISQIIYQNIIQFWKDISKKKPYDLSLNILTALFPMLSVLLIVSIGVLNPRFDKNHSALYSIFLLLLSILLFLFLFLIST